MGIRFKDSSFEFLSITDKRKHQKSRLYIKK